MQRELAPVFHVSHDCRVLAQLAYQGLPDASLPQEQIQIGTSVQRFDDLSTLLVKMQR